MHSYMYNELPIGQVDFARKLWTYNEVPIGQAILVPTNRLTSKLSGCLLIDLLLKLNVEVKLSLTQVLEIKIPQCCKQIIHEFIYFFIK